MNYERTDCRLCGGYLIARLALTPTPPANAFAAKPDLQAQRYPLELMQCRDCKHVQVGYVLDGEKLYTGYKYSTPEAMKPYLRRSADHLKKRFPRASCVLEIGSNNGMNADIMRSFFPLVLEVDPSGTSPHCMAGVPFSLSYAKALTKVDLIVANHVFAHIDDLEDVFAGVSECLTDEGALVFEVQYLPHLMRRGAFDMIYHEHRDYHTLGPLFPFARRHGLVLTEWEILPDIQGGSIKVTMRKQGREAFVPEESTNWNDFIDLIKSNVESLRENVPEGAILFGAPAKACTLLHHAGIVDRIKYAVDDTPEKQGCYIPGTDIRIYPTKTLYESKSAKTILLASWNYADVIKQNHPQFDYIEPFKEFA